MKNLLKFITILIIVFTATLGFSATKAPPYIVSSPDCTWLTFYGVLCHDTDDGKLYKWSGATQVELATAAGTGDITDVWNCSSGDCQDLTAGAADSLNASSASYIIPFVVGADCSAVTAEGRACWDSDDNILYVGDGAAAHAVGTGITSIGDTGDNDCESGACTYFYIGGVRLGDASPDADGEFGFASNQFIFYGGALVPATDNAYALGNSTGSQRWSDIFLGDGAVINFYGGDITLTHGSNLLTLGGGNLALGTNSLTMTGSIGATGARVTKGWFTDLESTNSIAANITGNAVSLTDGDKGSITASSGTLTIDDSAVTAAMINLHGATAETTIADADEVLIYSVANSANRRMTKGNFVAGITSSGIILDLTDDGDNESTSLGEVATSNDTNSIFTEPSANKLLIDVSKAWPTATVANTVVVAESTDATSYIAMFDSSAATTPQAIKSDTALTYAATTGILTASGFAGPLVGAVTGAVTGNADTATALASNPTDCSSNQFANAIAANGNLTCAQPATSNLSDATSIAMLADDETVTGSWTFGNADTDTLTVRSMIIGGNSREVQINAGARTTPTYASATPTQDLYVAGNVEVAGTIYGAAGNFGIGTDGSRQLVLTSNTGANIPTASGNKLYFIDNVLKVVEDGTAKDVPLPGDSVTWTGTSHSFAGVTNLRLPTASADSSGEVSINPTNHQLLLHAGGASADNALQTFDFDTCSANYILKTDGSGNWTCAADDTGGSPALSTVGDPSGDTTITMGAGEEVNFDYTGNFTTGSQFKIEQKTGNPSGGTLFEVKAADTDITVAKLGDGTNYTQIATNGNLSFAGTATFSAAGATTSIPMVVGTGTASGVTAAGQMYFESDTEILTIGDGATSISLDMAPNVVYTFPAATSTLARTDAGQTFTGVQAFTAPTVATSIAPATADGATLGTAAAEFSDLYLAAGGVIYGQNGQENTLTSSDTGWVTNLGFTIGSASPDDVRPTLVINGDADSDAAGDTNDAFTITLTPNATPTLATWGFTSTQSAGYTFDKNVTFAGDITVTGADITLAAAGVKLSGANGALTILGLGDGQDEDVKIDLNTTANTIIVSSPASSATTLSLSALNLVTTGTIQGGVTINSDANGMSKAEMTAAGAYGTLFVATGAGTWILPTAVQGMSLCVTDSGTAHDLIVDCADGDTIMLKGTEQAANLGITNAAGSTTGDFVCFVATAAGKWMTMGIGGAWLSQ